MRIERKLFLVAIAMFGFGYALVPLYNVFCEVTGLNGKTGKISAEKIDTRNINPDRWVTVEFDTNVNSELPWNFRSEKTKMKVHPGELADAIFVVENKSNIPLIGQAIPSVAPAQASLFFNKTECFCFVQQTLAPGERKEMRVKFVVGTGLPEKISTLTLSYTFFKAKEPADVARAIKNVTDRPFNNI